MTQLRLEFLGGAGTVTGSRTLLRFEDRLHLVDCGLFQGPRAIREKNWTPFPVEASKIQSVLLTHAHLDHSGYLPRLHKEGFQGPIYCSQGTADLCEVLWLDSAKLQEEDAEYANKTGYSRHKPAAPLYKTRDVKSALKLLKPQPEGESWHMDKNLSVILHNAGHIVGANFAEMSVRTGNRSWKLCFSGDLGHDRSLTLRGPEAPPESDFLVLESTYGDREHDRGNGMKVFAKHINETCSRGGVLVIPSFAVGRSQELLYMTRLLEDQNKVPSYPVILDSPMAHRATDLYLKSVVDHQLRADFAKIDRDNFFPHNYEATKSPDDSFGACMREGPMIVISAAGMLSGGRILHHLKSRLPDEKNRVLFVGFQGEGTKGRFLLEQGESFGSLRIHKQEIPVNAEIDCLDTLSAHADQRDMTQWLKAFPGDKPPRVILNHGEELSSANFKLHLEATFPGIKVDVAYEGMKVDFSEHHVGIASKS